MKNHRKGYGKSSAGASSRRPRKPTSPTLTIRVAPPASAVAPSVAKTAASPAESEQSLAAADLAAEYWRFFKRKRLTEPRLKDYAGVLSLCDFEAIARAVHREFDDMVKNRLVTSNNLTLRVTGKAEKVIAHEGEGRERSGTGGALIWPAGVVVVLDDCDRLRIVSLPDCPDARLEFAHQNGL